MSEQAGRNTESRPRLGRGLAALLGDSKSGDAAGQSPQGVKQVPIEFLRSNAKNPRQRFDESDLEELASSIRERGIIQPILVRPISGTSNAYEIVAGERRWRAAQKAGQHSVPIISLEIGDRDALELAIIENVQRADLNALEEAGGYARLAAEYGYSHSDIARVIGKSRSHVTNTLRLTGLPAHTRELLSAGAITAGHARALLSMPDPDNVADKVIARGLTVRDVENLANSSRQTAGTKKRKLSEIDPDTKSMQEKLALRLGAKVEIRNSDNVHQLRINFRDLEQLTYICEKLAIG